MPLKLPAIKKMAIIRALPPGDMLCSVPAFRALRHAYPDAEITLLGLPWAAGFVKRFDNYFDRFIQIPGLPGSTEALYAQEAWQFFLHQVNFESFDLVIQMHDNGILLNAQLQYFGARHLAGYHTRNSFMSSDLFMEYPDFGPEVKRHLLLMKHLGIPEQGTRLEFPLTEKDYCQRDELLLPLTTKKYVCIHPGSDSRQQWPPGHFALLADYCNKRGHIAVLTGTKDDWEINREVRKCLEQPAIDLTGLTSLGCLAVLIKEARLVISNSAVVAHIAAAVNTPGVIISLDGEPERRGHPIHFVADWTRQPSLEKVLLYTDELLETQQVAV